MYSKPDFEAKIRLLTKKEGGRAMLPIQGIRCNFVYDGEPLNYQFSIWTEFLDENKNPIQEGTLMTQSECYADFYIFDRETAETIHKNKIKVGVEFNMMEGGEIIGKGIVTDIF